MYTNIYKRKVQEQPSPRCAHALQTYSNTSKHARLLVPSSRSQKKILSKARLRDLLEQTLRKQYLKISSKILNHFSTKLYDPIDLNCVIRHYPTTISRLRFQIQKLHLWIQTFTNLRFKSNPVLDVRTHFKPTQTLQNTHVFSCHPTGVKKRFHQRRGSETS